MLLEEKRKRKRDGSESDPLTFYYKEHFVKAVEPLRKSLAEEKMYGIFKERVTQRAQLR